jgi:hypothetical protein
MRNEQKPGVLEWWSVVVLVSPAHHSSIPLLHYSITPLLQVP